MTGQKLVAVGCDTDANAGTTSCGVGGIGYFGGKRLGVVTDRLGSVRWSYGTSMSYFPYGEERTVTADGTEKFGTYFRDGVGQDYAEQRYYNNGTGRFWSVDPGGIGSADPSTPTSLNRYAYTNGDPVNFFDRRGLIAQAPSAEDCIANPEYCEAWDWNSAYGCNPGMYLVAQPGCETGGGGGAEDSEAEPIECEAVMYYRPVDDPTAKKYKATHSYWEVVEYDPNTDTTILDVISGGPKERKRGTLKHGQGTYLDVWVQSPPVPPDTPQNGTQWFDSGLSASNCTGVSRVLSAANSWPQDTILYKYLIDNTATP